MIVPFFAPMIKGGADHSSQIFHFKPSYQYTNNVLNTMLSFPFFFRTNAIDGIILISHECKAHIFVKSLILSLKAIYVKEIHIFMGAFI